MSKNVLLQKEIVTLESIRNILPTIFTDYIERKKVNESIEIIFSYGSKINCSPSEEKRIKGKIIDVLLKTVQSMTQICREKNVNNQEIVLRGKVVGEPIITRNLGKNGDLCIVEFFFHPDDSEHPYKIKAFNNVAEHFLNRFNNQNKMILNCKLSSSLNGNSYYLNIICKNFEQIKSLQEKE